MLAAITVQLPTLRRVDQRPKFPVSNYETRFPGIPGHSWVGVRSPVTSESR
jgi:hypothetical protein